jgi:hypothetical protein
MMNQSLEGNEKQLPESAQSKKHPSKWLHAIKGVFRGISTVIRPRQSFLFIRKKVKPDGSSTETIISYDID